MIELLPGPVVKDGTALNVFIPSLLAALERRDARRAHRLKDQYSEVLKAIYAGDGGHDLKEHVRAFAEDLEEALIAVAPARYTFGLRDDEWGFWREDR